MQKFSKIFSLTSFWWIYQRPYFFDLMFQSLNLAFKIELKFYLRAKQLWNQKLQSNSETTLPIQKLFWKSIWNWYQRSEFPIYKSHLSKSDMKWCRDLESMGVLSTSAPMLFKIMDATTHSFLAISMILIRFCHK